MKYIVYSLIATILVFSMVACGPGNHNTQVPKGHSQDSLLHSFSKDDTMAESILFLKNGINHIDLNGDDIKDMVISGNRNNVTAHSFSYYTFYVFQRDLSDEHLPWGIVEIEGKEKYNISTYQGADGILSDIAFVKNSSGKYGLVKADRDFGKSFADSGRVKFSYFSLKYDSLESRYFYKIKEDKYSEFKYVDVHQAISRELK